MLLPSRMAVLNYMATQKKVDVKQVMAALKAVYGTEKQFNEKLYTEHLMALEANGLAELVNYDLNDNEELVIHYQITEDGRQTVAKYVDPKFRVS